MKKLALLLCLFCLPLIASAGMSPYIKGNIGYNYMDFDAKGGYTIFSGSGYNAGLEIGNNFSDKFRGGLSYSFIKTSASSDLDARDSYGIPCSISVPEVQQHIILLNGFYYPLKKAKINPFVGAGAGWGFLNNTGDYYTDKNNNFAYALYLGVDYDITERISFDITGNYTSILAPISQTKDIYNLGGTLGIRYKF
jgi:opacity protein-like surface antigen